MPYQPPMAWIVGGPKPPKVHQWKDRSTNWDLVPNTTGARSSVIAPVIQKFELTFNKADADWQNSRISFRLTPDNGKTSVSFRHVGWPEMNEHYKISCFCWAMYLRLLKRYVETGETVPYEIRLDV
ncbi:MAG TPA: SRPBCC domain-containing protein [Pyrinomonadaceae bacterium]